jgi:hypothetical protein
VDPPLNAPNGVTDFVTPGDKGWQISKDSEPRVAWCLRCAMRGEPSGRKGVLATEDTEVTEIESLLMAGCSRRILTGPRSYRGSFLCVLCGSGAVEFCIHAGRGRSGRLAGPIRRSRIRIRCAVRRKTQADALHLSARRGLVVPSARSKAGLAECVGIRVAIRIPAGRPAAPRGGAGCPGVAEAGNVAASARLPRWRG